MRVEIPVSEVRPGDNVWFPNKRKPTKVESVEVFDGVEKQVVLNSEGVKWYQFITGTVNKYIPDEQVEEERQFLDPDGNPT